jgi:hypothetical protein
MQTRNSKTKKKKEKLYAVTSINMTGQNKPTHL